jgi:hypothetical protein
MKQPHNVRRISVPFHYYDGPNCTTSNTNSPSVKDRRIAADNDDDDDDDDVA